MSATEHLSIPHQSAEPVAPCASACPLGLGIERFAAHIAAGDYAKAIDHLMAHVPLPETACRVCDRPCEANCLRGSVDEPVAIGELERFVVEWAAAKPRFPWRPVREPASGKHVVVVGAGPSGLAAAADLCIRGHDVTLLDAADRPGGLLARAIPAYRLPHACVDRDIARVLDLGVSFRGAVRLGDNMTLGGLLAECDAVYLAVGAWWGKKLSLPGVGAPGVPASIAALDYLEAVAMGRQPPAGRRVVVIGGGNAAIHAARTALRRGAERVVLACAESRDAMPAVSHEIDSTETEGVEIRPEVWPSGLDVGAVVVESLASDDRPASRLLRLPADLVIIAIGQSPDLSFLDGDGSRRVRLRTTDGYLEVDPETGVTSHPRVFAGGDSVGSERTVTAAMGWGMRAAWGIDRMLRGAERADRRPPPPRPATRSELPAHAIGGARSPRRRGRVMPIHAAVSGFDEVNAPLSEAAARAEAARCLRSLGSAKADRGG